MITDAAGVIQDVNPALENITGYDRLELIGNNPYSRVASTTNPFTSNYGILLQPGRAGPDVSPTRRRTVALL